LNARHASFALLITLIASAAASAQQSPEPASARAVVVLFSKSLAGTSCSNGFTIGDGSLIVAPHHVIYPRRSVGEHQGDAFVTVLSPYLGDATEAEIVAQDRESDIAILRTKWKNHPALKLADDNDVVSTEEITLMSYSSIVSAVRGSSQADVTSPIRIDVQPLTVDFAAVRKGAPVTLHARPVAGLTTSATGGPMLLSGVGEVAAFFARVDGGRAIGPTANQIRALLEATPELAAAANPATQSLPRPAGAAQATVLLAKAVAASAAQQPQDAFSHLQAFLKLRPKCAVACRDAAGQAHALGQLDECQVLYGKALELEPSLTSARILYGQLLQERNLTGHGLTQLRYAWQHGPTPTAAVIPMVNILNQLENKSEALEILNEAVKKSPNDVYLWTYLARARREAKDCPNAAAAFLRAFELTPDDLALRVQAADAFDAGKDLAQAEAHYRAVVEIAPNSSAAHFFLARFLANNPQTRNEALTSAQKSLELSDQPGAPPRDKITALIATLTSDAAAKPQSKM
jgi:tetratricopeptide (TPR) repeat protein